MIDEKAALLEQLNSASYVEFSDKKSGFYSFRKFDNKWVCDPNDVELLAAGEADRIEPHEMDLLPLITLSDKQMAERIISAGKDYKLV